MPRANLKAMLPRTVRTALRSGRERLRGGAERLASWWHRPDVHDRSTPERVGAVYTAPTHLPIADRLVLYALVRGTRPERVLEIGSALGGSASIMAAAMEDAGRGRIVGLDPLPRIDARAPRYHGRFTLITARAPEGIEAARQAAGGNFDLVYYDGPNVYSEVKRIIDALIPHLADPARLLFDNGLHFGVHEAVREAIEHEPRLHDAGFLTVTPELHEHVAYLGLRLVRFDSVAVSEPQPWIDLAARAAGREPPRFDADVLDHDVWWCREVRACPRCAAGRSRVPA
jgi:predicted O-methyltransferase YrrM